MKQQPGNRFNYTFFRGKKDLLVGGPVLEPSETTVTVTVVQDGKEDLELQCPGRDMSPLLVIHLHYFCVKGGTNMRRLLVGNGVNVYRSITRWTNCNGKQRCGTCIVDVRICILYSFG
jgi:hypothetical protein